MAVLCICLVPRDLPPSDAFDPSNPRRRRRRRRRRRKKQQQGGNLTTYDVRFDGRGSKSAQKVRGEQILPEGADPLQCWHYRVVFARAQKFTGLRANRTGPDYLRAAGGKAIAPGRDFVPNGTVVIAQRTEGNFVRTFEGKWLPLMGQAEGSYAGKLEPYLEVCHEPGAADDWAGANAPLRFAVGDLVEGNYNGSGDWYSARITKQNRDPGEAGTYNLEYDDGDEETFVPEVYVRAIEPLPNARPAEQPTTAAEEGPVTEGASRIAEARSASAGSFDSSSDEGLVDKRARLEEKLESRDPSRLARGGEGAYSAPAADAGSPDLSTIARKRMRSRIVNSVDTDVSELLESQDANSGGSGSHGQRTGRAAPAPRAADAPRATDEAVQRVREVAGCSEAAAVRALEAAPHNDIEAAIGILLDGRPPDDESADFVPGRDSGGKAKRERRPSSGHSSERDLAASGTASLGATVDPLNLTGGSAELEDDMYELSNTLDSELGDAFEDAEP
jgi:hypothetical protein